MTMLARGRPPKIPHPEMGDMCPAGHGAADATGTHRAAPSPRAGYTVMPCSSSATSLPPPVAARPVPFARSRPVAGPPACARAAGRTGLPRAGCGDFVWILKVGDGACGMPLPAFPQAGWLGA